MCTAGVGSLALNAFVINRREGRGEYHSMSRDEFMRMLDGRRTEGVDESRVETTMARQSVLATASKALVA